MDHAFPQPTEAGCLLAEKLAKYADRDDVLWLGLAAGGVPVAFEVAQGLGAARRFLSCAKLVFRLEELAAGAMLPAVCAF